MGTTLHHTQLSKWIQHLNVRPASTKLLEEKRGRSSLTFVLVIFFFFFWQQKQRQQSKNQYIGLHQTKKVLHNKKPSTKCKGKLLHRRKYLQIIYLIRGLHPKYIKNSHKSTGERGGQKIWIDILPEEMQTVSRYMEKYSTWQKRKSKPQWDIASYLLE